MSGIDKNSIRERVREDLLGVAIPNAFFHLDLDSFIPDFFGSEVAIERVIWSPEYRNAQVIFITPDDCLRELRERALRDGKIILVTSYGIRRGFFLLTEGIVLGNFKYASTLEGMEKVGVPVSLSEIVELGYQIDLLVTGAGAVCLNGLRIGKGHGFFDLEWAILMELKLVTVDTPVFCVVHDCQVVQDEIEGDEFDTACDVIFTPTRGIPVHLPNKPTLGIDWSRITDVTVQEIPCLNELKILQTKGGD